MKYKLTHRCSVVFLLVVFTNAFLDLGHKILLQNTLFHTSTPHQYLIYASVLNAFILLPYIAFFTPSGFISDKFSKPKVMFWTAAAAIPITLMITVCYYCGWFWFAFYLTLLLGLQSAINSPAKYGHIKEIFSQADLAQGNAYTQTMAILGILAGTAVYTVLFTVFSHVNTPGAIVTKASLLKSFAPLGFSLVLLSCLETVATLFLAKQPAADGGSHYSIKRYLTLQYVAPYWRHISGSKTILICILSLSVFWGANQVLLVAYGAFLKSHVTNIDPGFAQYAIAIAGIGVLLGTVYMGRVSKGYIETGVIPVALIAIVICLSLLTVITHSIVGIIVLLLAYGFFGGMFIVPLNALIQYHANNANLGKVLAGNNFSQNVFMFTFLIGTTVASLFQLNSVYILHGLLLMFIVLAAVSVMLLPQSLIRYVLALFVRRSYRLQVEGVNQIPEQGGVMLIGNHTSFVDWAVLQIACPRKIRFVMERSIFNTWYLKWLFSALKIIPVSRGSSKVSIERMQAALNQGEVVCLFPEGRLSRNGQIGQFYSGFTRAVEGTQAVIIPFYLRGLWGSKKVSYATPFYQRMSKLRVRETTVAFGSRIAVTATVDQAKQAVMQASSKAWNSYARSHSNIARAVYDRSKILSGRVALIDPMAPKMTYNTLMGTVLYLRQSWKKMLVNQQNIGVILPSGAAGVCANLTLFALGKTVVNFNFTASEDSLKHAKVAAECQFMITSRRFLKKLEGKGVCLDVLLANCHVIYMEDCISKKSRIHILRKKILHHFLPRFIGRYWFCHSTQYDQTAAIIFSSGSEGKPKGVELTHGNILVNIKQTATVCNVRYNDVMLGVLPLFHAFGLTTSTFMPLVIGSPLVCYADPTDAQTIGKLICRHKVTIMYGTSTFFNLYNRNRKCLPEMLASIRIAVAGAEKLSPQVAQAFQLKFNKVIMEGYGTTELSPVSGCNLPNELDERDLHVQVAQKSGTVGLPLPGTAYRIIDPETLKAMPTGEDGLILVSGPQLMKGYLNDPVKTDEVMVMIDGLRWYKTGDKGHLDAEGFLTIVDRYSRFAKIAGEMVSLSAVEQKIVALLGDEVEVMAVAVPDARKGEVVQVLYCAQFTQDEFKQQLLNANFDNLMLPAKFLKVDELPKLGSGKRDYVTAKKQLILRKI